MAKTSKQVQGDVYRLLKDSTLYSMISGEVYRQGYRPRDSRLEDAVVIFTAGLPDQIQTGVVTVHIYCPDIDPYGNGVLVEDGQRTEDLKPLRSVGLTVSRLRSLVISSSCSRRSAQTMPKISISILSLSV